MKKFILSVVFIGLMISFFAYQTATAGVFKWLRVGKYQTKVVDSGDQGEAAGEGTFAYWYLHDFTYSCIDHAGWQLGTKDWTDDRGTYWPYKISGAGHGNSDESTNTIPVTDADGLTIHRYYRYQPPEISVDGYRLDEPFPQFGDEVAPDKIPGTADMMVESWIKTSMGITIHQKALAWSQVNHDDYIIYDWTFTNTGDVDMDDDIELPNQTVKDVYFWRANNWRTGRSRNWNSTYGEYPGDSLRMSYAYPQRSSGSETDDFGEPRPNGFLRRSHYIGEAMLHVDTSADDPTDDPSQPRMTADYTAEILWAKNESNITTPADHALLYQTMSQGFYAVDGVPYLEGTYPNTYHSQRLDERGLAYVTDMPWWNWRACSYTASGPFTLGPGESFRIVWATVMGSLSKEKSWEVGRAWLNETCTWDGPDDLADYYPPYRDNPELVTSDNDYAKDRWVCTGKDSLFANAWAAQWAVRNDYDVPTAPPAPSVSVKALPNKVQIEWGSESEQVSDFAGYRVYRAIGTPDTTYFKIYECGEGTGNPLAHSYEDTDAQRGLSYYYWVAAFDNGTDNKPGVKGVRESLESGKYVNRTTRGAHLTRDAGTLSTARVVPNPFHIKAKDLQFIGEPDKIMFMDLPPQCTIDIYTESGDLIETLEHTDGSGDEPWGLTNNEHSTTSTGQIVVSGIYIARIYTEDESTILKFLIVR